LPIRRRLTNKTMDSQYTQEIVRLFRQYYFVLKPLLTVVEATYEEFPVQIHNEIRSFTDRIALCYGRGAGENEIAEHLRDASSHINRAILDCYKFLNVYSHDSIKQFEFETRYVDLTLVSDGDFYREYLNLKSKAVRAVKLAKDSENERKNDGIDATYELYQAANNAYTELRNYIDENMPKIDLAGKRYRKIRRMNYAGTALSWVISGVIGAVIAIVIGWFINVKA